MSSNNDFSITNLASLPRQRIGIMQVAYHESDSESILPSRSVSCNFDIKAEFGPSRQTVP
jgi:hypothetical protein